MKRLIPFLLLIIFLLPAVDAHSKSLAPDDVAIVSIDSDPVIVLPAGISPKLTVRNKGTNPQTFDILVTTTDGYSSTINVVNLAAGESRQIIFANWVPSLPGPQVLTATAMLIGDAVQADNALSKTFTSFASFPNNGWTSKAALPMGQWGHPVVAQSNSNYDAALIYSISGSDQTFGVYSQVQVFNTQTNSWSNVAAIPQARQQVNAALVAGKIYVPGGYQGSFIATNRLDIYDIATNTWSVGAPLLQATGDYAIAVYNDAYIYVIGGYSGSADINNVQVYDIAANTWTNGTAKPGQAAAGLRGGISNGKLIIGGGYSQALGKQLATAYQGVINPANPADITWTTLPDFPYGVSGRLAAGALFDRVYFAAGDPSGSGTQARDQVWAYNTLLSKWEVGPVKPSKSNNIFSLAPVLLNGKAYLVFTGGYNGSAVTNVHEWLELGDYCNLTATTSQQDIDCYGEENGSATVTPAGVNNVYQYTWNTTPVQTTPTATNLSAGNYEVAIKSLGCTITKNFTITEKAKIVLAGIVMNQGTVGATYNQTIAATLGSGDYEYSIATGSLPAGVNLSDDGIFSGTPGEAGSFPLLIAAKDITCNHIVTANATLVIRKASQSINLVTVAAKTYGDLPFVPGASSTSGLPVTYTSADNTIAEGFQDAADGNKWKLRIHKAGTVSIAVNQTGNGNYNAATAQQFSLTVNPKSVTIIILPGAIVTKVYDGSNQGTLNGSDIGFTAGNIINGDIVQLQVTPAASRFNTKHAATGKTLSIPVSSITLIGAQAGNYTIANTGTVSISNASITAAPLSIIVDAQTKVYGTADPELSYSETGLITGDAITGEPSRTAGENAGLYPITQGTLSAGANYSISFTGNTFTITKAPQTITWTQELLVGCNSSVLPIQLTATSSNNRPVIFSVANTKVATVNGSILTPLVEGATVVTASLAANANYEDASPVSIAFQYKLTSAIRQHWADAIFFDNSGNKYVQWQWYKNGNAINGANSPYYSESTPLQGVYHVSATDRNGNIAQTCPVTLSGAGALSVALKVAPNPGRAGTTATVTCNYPANNLAGARLIISNVTGAVIQQITSVQQTNTVKLPSVTGVYMITLLLSNGQRETVNVLVK